MDLSYIHSRGLAFMAKVQPDPGSDCVLWVGGRRRRDYGVFRWMGWTPSGLAMAHQISLFLFTGYICGWDEVPDHLCHVHPCVNPLHLNPIPYHRNSKQGGSYRHRKDF